MNSLILAFHVCRPVRWGIWKACSALSLHRTINGLSCLIGKGPSADDAPMTGPTQKSPSELCCAAFLGIGIPSVDRTVQAMTSLFVVPQLWFWIIDVIAGAQLPKNSDVRRRWSTPE